MCSNHITICFKENNVGYIFITVPLRVLHTHILIIYTFNVNKFTVTGKKRGGKLHKNRGEIIIIASKYTFYAPKAFSNASFSSSPRVA